MTDPDRWARDEETFRFVVLWVSLLTAIACGVAVVVRFVHFLYSP